MTEQEISEVATRAAAILGHDAHAINPASHARLCQEVSAANTGGQDDTTVGQAVRKALREFREKPVTTPKVTVKIETITKKK